MLLPCAEPFLGLPQSLLNVPNAIRVVASSSLSDPTSMLVVLVSQTSFPDSAAREMQRVHVLVSSLSINIPPTGLLTALPASPRVAINMSYSFWKQVNPTSVARRRRRDASSTAYIPIVVGDPEWCGVSSSSQCDSSSNTALQSDTQYLYALAHVANAVRLVFTTPI